MPKSQPAPQHLQRYVVEQNYSRYTSEDQAVWRFIMRQLKDFLSRHAHSAYGEGLQKTGIDIESIPDIAVMDERLAEFGWRAVPVSGFIPPAAFMEFQSLGILPIASDMRTVEHLTYTPAPDIVHEAAGHAPMLILPEYAKYLQKYAEVARNAIISKKDMNQYEAIRILSDVKENPESTPEQIATAERRLTEVNRSLTEVSEAGWLSRMNWWTAEYGLVGPLAKPQIFGAGLLSSVGESRHCLSSKVRKIPLTVSCIDVSYDITEPQPQLFVTENFQHLLEVLEALANKMAFRIGGVVGLQRAKGAQTVTTVELDSGLQISGVLENYLEVDFFKMSGPVTLSAARRLLNGHGRDRHAQGFSSPLGRLMDSDLDLSTASDSDLARLGLRSGQPTSLKFASGIELSGETVGWTRHGGKTVLIEFKNCQVRRGDEIFFKPEWGSFDLAVGRNVTSVFGGPADRAAFGETDDFVASLIPLRKPTPEQTRMYDFYSRLRSLRNSPDSRSEQQWKKLAEEYTNSFTEYWLMGIELVEMVSLLSLDGCREDEHALIDQLQAAQFSPMGKECVSDGLRLAETRL